MGVGSNWLSFIPDYATNRLHIKLNYEHSAILFSDAGCTMASTLGFTSDVVTTAERFLALATTAISVDIMWRLGATDDSGNPLAYKQFSVTLPAQPVRGYTAAQIKDDLNTLVEDYLYINHSVGPALSPFNAMVASLDVNPGPSPGTYLVKMQYTDATKVMVRGDMHDETTDTSSLPRGQLRAGLPNPSYVQMGSSTNWQYAGNPYATHSGYLSSLFNAVADSATNGTVYPGPTTNEINTAMFLLACGFAAPNHQTTMTNIDNAFGSGLSFFHNVSNLHDAEAQTAPHIDSVTEIGLAVEPIVQGPRDTSGKTSGTLARFVIPKGSQPGDVLAFEADNPTRVSVQRYTGAEISQLTFRLVDQHIAAFIVS
eukprot:SAG11_NODE_2036_length_3895_cov_6.213646_3_plen_370_part_00